ncbi:VWA domain-containing protein [Alteromonadaceae bacterium M269]|nr:VWA domain-containing protein [Alteromonadaceae bacterium M269]
MRRRSADGFNLAFLDVMACGLGAVILIFMLVKFHAQTAIPSDEIERLKAELEQLTSVQQALNEDVKKASEANARKSSEVALTKEQIEALIKQAQDNQKSVDEKLYALANLETAAAAAAPKQADDSLTIQGTGEENYLLGLKVEGRHIGILVDYSASMTEQKLAEIIKRKIGSDAEKQNAPKWQRTLRVARWLLARAPKTSEVAVVAFNKEAQSLGSKPIVSAGNEADLQALSSELSKLVPANGTNLQLALKKMVEVNPDMTNLYVITDGLPTLADPDDKQLTRNLRCRSFGGRASTISGECRAILFNRSYQSAGLGNTEVNVILLPLEGDPDASHMYWDWTSDTGGLTLTPADSWP